MGSFNDRYAKHLALPEFNPSHQHRLRNSRVLLVGAGGLGSPAALYLAAAGVGTLIVVDADKVQLANLQRQILYTTSDLGKPKTSAAIRRLADFNPLITLIGSHQRFDETSAKELLDEADIVIDATDNFESKFLINDLCVEQKIPLIHGGVTEWAGQAMTILPGESACYRCVFKDLPSSGNSHRQKGIFGPVPGIIGTVQAAEALKQLTGLGTLLTDRLFILDAKNLSTRIIPIHREKHCPCCR